MTHAKVKDNARYTNTTHQTAPQHSTPLLHRPIRAVTRTLRPRAHAGHRQRGEGHRRSDCSSYRRRKEVCASVCTSNAVLASRRFFVHARIFDLTEHAWVGASIGTNTRARARAQIRITNSRTRAPRKRNKGKSRAARLTQKMKVVYKCFPVDESICTTRTNRQPSTAECGIQQNSQ